MKKRLCLTGILFYLTAGVFAQGQLIDKIGSLPDHLFSTIQSKTAKLDERITRRTEKYLARLARKEKKLQHKLFEKDSAAAQNLFAGSEEKYKSLASKLKEPASQNIQHPLHEYIPGLDSITSAIHFLRKTGSLLPNDKLNQVQAVSTELQQLQGRLQQANDIGEFIKQRELELKNQLSGYGLGKELAGINKEAFYYGQQLAEYKNLLHDPDKLERKILSALSNVPAFQTFMQKESYLAQLFGLPDTYSNITSLAGLQTRSQVEQLIANNIGSAAGGANPEQFVMEQIQRARQALSQLKDKLNFLGSSGGAGDITMPSFKKNDQRTKTFLKRLEYGFNIQTQPTTRFLPNRTSIAILVGYKLKDNFSFGVGGSYLLGMGNGLDHIRFSNQGIGIRSYLDLKAKGNIFLSGGFEYNFMQEFQSLQGISHFDTWQKSALVGLSKQYKISKNKKNNIQLLFDALYKQHTPPSSPVIFRMGQKF